MYCDNGAELSTGTNSETIHIINRSSGKNCSTSSTDSGVGLVDNAVTYKVGPTTNDNSYKTSRKCDDTRQRPDPMAESEREPVPEPQSESTKAEAEAELNPSKRISIEVEATVNLNKATFNGPKKSSPALSIRSTTISIMSIDENAIDSSCIDSDSEAEPDESCTVHKLGHQVIHPPQSAELAQLNKGLTVISRQVVPSGSGGPPLPTAPDIVAKQLLNGNLNLATPTTPTTAQQIGSIALTNTTDVTFGDKHYYEGPVTIQQILIDSREKWKSVDGEAGGQDNPGFDPKAPANGNAAGAKLNESCEEPAACPFLPNAISRRAILITVAILLLFIVLGVVLANVFGKQPNKSKLGDGDDSRQNIPINSTIDKDNIGGGLVLRYVPRAVWLAQPPQRQLPSLELPVPMVIVLPTNSENCSTQAQCVFRVRFLQTFDIESQQRDDITYNFLIGGDGNVYVGRGWDVVGAHMPNYNKRSLSLAYIGSFRHQRPSSKQLTVTQLLLNEGVSEGKIAPNYKLVGASTLEPSITEYNADQLYESFANWTHWTTALR